MSKVSPGLYEIESVIVSSCPHEARGVQVIIHHMMTTPGWDHTSEPSSVTTLTGDLEDASALGPTQSEARPGPHNIYYLGWDQDMRPGLLSTD